MPDPRRRSGFPELSVLFGHLFMSQRSRSIMIVWVLLAAAAPPPLMAGCLIAGVAHRPSPIGRGTPRATSDQPSQTRGRNRVNSPVGMAFCFATQGLEGGEKFVPIPPSPRDLGLLEPPLTRFWAKPPLLARSTTPPLRC